MRKLLQINVSLNYLSTGKIAEGIAEVASTHGWDCYTAFSGRYYRESSFPSIKVSSFIEELIHYAGSLAFDRQGLGSYYATKRLVKHLETINPDIIHLHVIHGSFINYKVLFQYAIKKKVPIVWTMHDCCPFTGHCVYFDQVGCNKWETHCCHCPQKKNYPISLGFDRSKQNFNLKKNLFSKVNSLTMVPVSEWLGNFVKQSFLGNKRICVIHNGIDLSVFKPTTSDVKKKFGIEDRFLIIGVANGFGKRKGLDDFIKLSSILGDSYKIMLIGASKDEIARIPSSIIALPRTSSQQELVEIYSAADVFANPTYEDNFPTTNLEALACGTPVITYDTGGSPEAIDSSTGIVIPQGDIEGFACAIKRLQVSPLLSIDCTNRASQYFDKNICFEEYIKLYDELLN